MLVIQCVVHSDFLSLLIWRNIKVILEISWPKSRLDTSGCLYGCYLWRENNVASCLKSHIRSRLRPESNRRVPIVRITQPHLVPNLLWIRLEQLYIAATTKTRITLTPPPCPPLIFVQHHHTMNFSTSLAATCKEGEPCKATMSHILLYIILPVRRRRHWLAILGTKSHTWVAISHFSLICSKDSQRILWKLDFILMLLILFESKVFWKEGIMHSSLSHTHTQNQMAASCKAIWLLCCSDYTKSSLMYFYPDTDLYLFIPSWYSWS